MKMKEAMKDMKREVDDGCCEVDMPKKKKGKEYPWSMNVDLQHEDLKKLGIDVSKLKTGTKVMLHAEAEITSLSASERDGKTKQRMTVQMQKLGLYPKKKVTMSEAMDDDDY